MNKELTGSYIESKFRAVPESGVIERLCRDGNWKIAGYIKPGTQSSGGGYRMISIPQGRTKVRAHHLVWMWVHGEWPKEEIDHINGNRDDNRIANLRIATVNQNRTNRTIQSNNKSGLKWVYKCCQTGKWRADVCYRENGEKKRFRVSGYNTPDAAYEVASNFAKSAHGKFYNPGKQ